MLQHLTHCPCAEPAVLRHAPVFPGGVLLRRRRDLPVALDGTVDRLGGDPVAHHGQVLHLAEEGQRAVRQDGLLHVEEVDGDTALAQLEVARRLLELVVRVVEQREVQVDSGGVGLEFGIGLLLGGVRVGK